MDEQDPNYAYQKPQPDQEAFLDQHLGSGPVTLYYDELAYDDGIDLTAVGAPIAELRTYKPELEETDILTVHSNVIWVNFSNTPYDGGVYAAFVKT